MRVWRVACRATYLKVPRGDLFGPEEVDEGAGEVEDVLVVQVQVGRHLLAPVVVEVVTGVVG